MTRLVAFGAFKALDTALNYEVPPALADAALYISGRAAGARPRVAPATVGVGQPATANHRRGPLASRHHQPYSLTLELFRISLLLPFCRFEHLLSLSKVSGKADQLRFPAHLDTTLPH